MTKKYVKFRSSSGRVVEVYAIRLPSGALLIPSRHDADRRHFTWREVAPGTSDHKRWLPVAVDEPDPRTVPHHPPTPPGGASHA